MLRLAARLSYGLEPGCAGCFDRDLGICGLMMIIIVLLPVLDPDAHAIAGEAHDLEFGGLLFTLELNVGADPQLDDVHPMRRDVGKYGAARCLNHEAMSEYVGDLAGQSGSRVRHLFLL